MKNFLLLILISSLFSSCVHMIDSLNEEVNEIVNDTCNVDITYAEDVKNIIASTCAIPGCHVNGGFKDFSNYVSLKSEIDQKGKAYFISRFETTGGMPPTYTQGPASLSECDKMKLRTWINAGYLNN